MKSRIILILTIKVWKLLLWWSIIDDDWLVMMIDWWWWSSDDHDLSMTIVPYYATVKYSCTVLCHFEEKLYGNSATVKNNCTVLALYNCSSQWQSCHTIFLQSGIVQYNCTSQWHSKVLLSSIDHDHHLIIIINLSSSPISHHQW